MKKFWKILALLSTSILIILFSTTLVNGAFQREAPVTVEVIPNVQDLNFYSNSSMTNPTLSFTYANFMRGSTETWNIWIRNDGVETLNNLVASLVGTISWGTLTLTPASIGTLAAGQYRMLTLTITVPITTSTGNYTGIKIVVNAP